MQNVVPISQLFYKVLLQCKRSISGGHCHMHTSTWWGLQWPPISTTPPPPPPSFFPVGYFWDSGFVWFCFCWSAHWDEKWGSFYGGGGLWAHSQKWPRQYPTNFWPVMARSVQICIADKSTYIMCNSLSTFFFITSFIIFQLHTPLIWMKTLKSLFGGMFADHGSQYP